MWKLKTFAIITIILGLVSLGWIFYDYLALSDIVYNFGTTSELIGKRHTITIGFIPIILFHFSFFATMFLMFDFLKHQKIIIKEHGQMKTENERLKAEAEALKPDMMKPDVIKPRTEDSSDSVSKQDKQTI